VLVVAVMATGLVGLLLLNIAMQNAAFQLAQLESRAQALHIRQQQLGLEVDRLASPEHLAQRASAQGMVPNTNPVFLDISNGGRVIGTPVPAQPGTGLVGYPPGTEAPIEPRGADSGPADRQRAGEGDQQRQARGRQHEDSQRPGSDRTGGRR